MAAANAMTPDAPAPDDREFTKFRFQCIFLIVRLFFQRFYRLFDLFFGRLIAFRGGVLEEERAGPPLPAAVIRPRFDFARDLVEESLNIIFQYN